MTDTITAALIAAVVAGLIFALTEVVKALYRRADKLDSSREIYLRYVNPITAATANLLWRLDEILQSSQSRFYLREKQHVAPFEQYKAASTLYRLAALLGWIQALRRELVFVSSTRPKQAQPLEDALLELQRTLADGHHVEVARVGAVLNLIDPKTTVSDQVMGLVGGDLDYELDRVLHSTLLRHSTNWTRPPLGRSLSGLSRSWLGAADFGPH